MISAFALEVVRIAELAGDLVRLEFERLRSGAPPDIAYKVDQSPCTAADVASNRVLAAGLMAIDPSLPLLSEEMAAVAYEERAHWDRYWLIDPLDGTKEFIGGHNDFTVNVALIEGGTPVLGVVHAPASGATFCAQSGRRAWMRDNAGGAFHSIKAADYRDAPRVKVVVSRSHAGSQTEAFLDRIGACERHAVGSSLKLCRIAEGSAHLYPRFGPTMEWDIAAAHCIVREAGGSVTDTAGAELRYNKADLHNPHFVAVGAPPFPWWRHLETVQGTPK